MRKCLAALRSCRRSLRVCCLMTALQCGGPQVDALRRSAMAERCCRRGPQWPKISNADIDAPTAPARSADGRSRLDADTGASTPDARNARCLASAGAQWPKVPRAERRTCSADLCRTRGRWRTSTSTQAPNRAAAALCAGRSRSSHSHSRAALRYWYSTGSMQFRLRQRQPAFWRSDLDARLARIDAVIPARCSPGSTTCHLAFSSKASSAAVPSRTATSTIWDFFRRRSSSSPTPTSDVSQGNLMTFAMFDVGWAYLAAGQHAARLFRRLPLLA